MVNVYRRRGRRSSGLGSWLRALSATGWIILVSTILSVIGFVTFAFGRPELFALKPSLFLEGKYLWTIVTHMFLHGGIFHLFINMFVLMSLGGLLERIIGQKRYVWLYVLSGVFAGLLSVALSGLYGATEFGARWFGSADVFMVGGSGAIFALAAMLMVLLPQLRFAIIFLPFFTLPAYVMVPLVLFVTWGASAVGGLPIGNVAHFGGFLVGLGYGLWLRRKYKRKIQILGRQFR
jgi:membrane associated rhomboid family serine protease